MENTKLNIIVVVSDTLRTAELGCYGNRRIQTPNIDRFAASGMRFLHAYPESLPTIPVRRTLHTGRRAYPFRDYRPLPWDIVYLPGWQPMDDHETTVAEDLAAAGYHTGFVADTLPYFAPGMNFTRGFWQWEFVRGKQQDRWKSVHAVDARRLAGYQDGDDPDRHNLVRYHLANTEARRTPETTCTFETFDWASAFVRDNRDVPFYLFVDTFDPHEPWDAPETYYRRYADGSFRGKRIVHTRYDRDFAGCTPEQVADIRANYCGLVSLVDAAFGRLLDTLDTTGLADRTVVIFTSDHGTNLGDNLWRVMGKPAWALLPGTMHIPLIVRHPRLGGAGAAHAGLRSNLDIPATVYDIAGAVPGQGRSSKIPGSGTGRHPDTIDGQSLLPCLAGGTRGDRAYLTCRYGDTVWAFDGKWWTFGPVSGAGHHVFDVESDPGLVQDRSAADDREARQATERNWRRILADGGGDLPDYSARTVTDAIGQRAVRR